MASNSFDCIVLGAGIAGVTAARDLQIAGLSVLLIEGADRIGGRIHSDRGFVKKDGKPIPVEAGAEYIHVEEKERYQEFWDEVHQQGFTASALHKCGMGFLRIPRNRLFFPRWSRTRMLGEVIGQPQLWEVPKCLDRLKDFDFRRKADLSARAFAARCAEEETLGPLARDLLEYTLTAHTPGGLDELSIAGIASDEIPSQLLEPIEFRMESGAGGKSRVCGNDSLPGAIAKQFQKSGGVVVKSRKGAANAKVVKVEKLADKTIEVTLQSGKSYRASSGICTFSAGMLNPESGEGDAIFGPLLPPKKRDALAVVRMGPITKFSLEFKERAWIDDGGYSAGHMTVLSNPKGKARTFFSSFPKEHNGPHVLTALMMNQDHKRIAAKDDATALRIVFDAVSRVYGRGKDWKMEDLLAGRKDRNGQFQPSYRRNDWSRDPFALGGNSFLGFVPANRSKVPPHKAREALKNPLQTLPLFWAGEATAPAYRRSYQPLAIHGAYISGKEAAIDVLHFLNKARGDTAKFGRYYRGKYAGSR